MPLEKTIFSLIVTAIIAGIIVVMSALIAQADTYTLEQNFVTGGVDIMDGSGRRVGSIRDDCLHLCMFDLERVDGCIFDLGREDEIR